MNLVAPFYKLNKGSDSTISTPAHKSANVLAKLKITVVQVVADFLTSIREVTIESIERTYGAEWVQKSVIEYVLTVPAIWSDAAKDLMVQAAMQAGFGVHRKNFHLVSEPEAAAAYSLSVIPPNSLKIGDTFVICDAGGGTVDLISYKITGVNPLKIVESVSGSGDLCGSVYLDQRFEEYIRAVLGDNAIDDMKLKSKTEMMRTWEAKVKFIYGHADSEDDYFEVTVPGVPDCEDTGVEDGFYTMDK